MKTRTGEFLLFVAGVILAFLLAELLVRVFLPQDKKVTWLEMHPSGFMMNQADIDAIHHFNDRKLRYHFNEVGLRDKETVSKDEATILLLGDSYTFGFLLNKEDTYATILQKNLDEHLPSKDFEILNGGVGGAGLADWPRWLEYNGQQISPDIIILYLNYMDVDRALSKNLYVVEGDSTLTESIRWQQRSFFIYLGRLGWYRWLQEHSELMNLVVKVAWRYLYFSDQTENFTKRDSAVPLPPNNAFDPESGYSLRLAELLTERMVNWCEINNCTFIMTTTGFFEKNDSGVHTYAYYDTLVNSRNDTFYFFDNTPCVNERINGNYDTIRIPGDSHPNEEGAEIIAECSLIWLMPFLDHYTGSP